MRGKRKRKLQRNEKDKYEREREREGGVIESEQWERNGIDKGKKVKW